MQQELTTLKDQITAVIRVSAHSAKHIADFEKLITTMPFNIVAVQLETFKLSERIASTVPCNLLVHARTTLQTAQIQYNNNIVPRQPLINAQNALQALNECTDAIDTMFKNCGIHMGSSDPRRVNSSDYQDGRKSNYRIFLRNQGATFIAPQNLVITACALINIDVILITIHDISYAPPVYHSQTAHNEMTIKKHYSYVLRQIQGIITTIQAQIKQEETNLAVLTQAQVALDLQIQLQNNRDTLANTFNTRATTLITLVSSQISPQSLIQSLIRARIMRSKTDTLRMIRRDRDYSSHREATLTLIETWWSVNTVPQREGDITFTNAPEETEHFLAMCTIFDAENDTSVFTDRADDFDTASISRFSRLSFASHPAAQQFL